MNARYFQVDVFTQTPGGGNPLGVVLDAKDWSDAEMQSFAAYTDLVETTFVLPPRAPGADYWLRIFTPYREIGFAGHPSLGSAHVLLDEGLLHAADGLLRQECGAGIVEIRRDGEDLFFRAPQARILAQGIEAHPLLAATLRQRALGALAPALVEGGRRWWMAEFANEMEVRAWHPDHAAIGALARASDTLGLCVFARSAADPQALVVRAFPAGVGIVEDPASGAANGLIGAYLSLVASAADPLRRGYVVSQGREIGHDATLRLRYADDGAVWVGGRTHTVIRGAVRWGR